MHHRINAYASLLLIAVLSVVSYSQLSDRHSHMVNGVLISHSHPYKHDNSHGNEEHEHTSADFALLAFFNDFQHYISSILDHFLTPFNKEIKNDLSTIYIVFKLPNYNLCSFCFRGPPCQLIPC